MVIDNLPRIEDVTQMIHPDPATDMVSDNPPSIEDMAQTIHLDPATEMASDNPPSIEDMAQTIHLDPATDMASDSPPSIEDMAQTIHPDPAVHMVSDNPPSVKDMAQTIHLDPAKVKEQFDRIRRFRILVVGRSNAGKTTLLQRVCNTTELPEIYNSNGEKVKYLILEHHRSLMPAICRLTKPCMGH